jgi:hypothetical protein
MTLTAPVWVTLVVFAAIGVYTIGCVIFLAAVLAVSLRRDEQTELEMRQIESLEDELYDGMVYRRSVQ